MRPTVRRVTILAAATALVGSVFGGAAVAERHGTGVPGITTVGESNKQEDHKTDDQKRDDARKGDPKKDDVKRDDGRKGDGKQGESVKYLKKGEFRKH